MNKTMERIFKSETTTTTTSYGENGTTHSISTITVRELDDGEVCIPSTGIRNILGPDDLKSHMLTVPIIDDDVSDTETSNSHFQLHDPTDDNWFPSLSKASWIQDLDKNDSGDEDTLMTDRTMETLFATDIIEIEDNHDNNNSAAAAKYGRPSKSRRTNRGAMSLGSATVDIDDDSVAISGSISSLENSSSLVPVNVVYSVLND